MFTPYNAQEAKAAADNYYLPLTQIFDYIRDNAKNGLYTVVVSGTNLTAQQTDLIRKCGYTIDVAVDEQDKVKYSISWS